jgi:hypothetical protein
MDEVSHTDNCSKEESVPHMAHALQTPTVLPSAVDIEQFLNGPSINFVAPGIPIDVSPELRERLCEKRRRSKRRKQTVRCHSRRRRIAESVFKSDLDEPWKSDSGHLREQDESRANRQVPLEQRSRADIDWELEQGEAEMAEIDREFRAEMRAMDEEFYALVEDHESLKLRGMRGKSLALI